MPVFRPLSANQVRVLVVEDEVSLRKLLMQTAQGWGFEVESAWSGEDAIRLNQASPFHIAILDYHLPRLDGLATLQHLREQTPTLQAIMLTGFGSVDIARQALHLEVVEFLTKPSSRGELEQALDRALRRTLVTPSHGVPDCEASPATCPGHCLGRCRADAYSGNTFPKRGQAFRHRPRAWCYPQNPSEQA